ncbi:MAG: hypothetical protein WBO92_02860 [Candidatus Moraniibacteriota bacterium]
MSTSFPVPTYLSLRQLQAFIFEAGIEEMLLRQGRPGYWGLPLYVKLSNTHMLRFQHPLPEDPEDKFLALKVKPEAAASPVILIDIEIEIRVLHAAIVQADLGHYLINLDR